MPSTAWLVEFQWRMSWCVAWCVRLYRPQPAATSHTCRSGACGVAHGLHGLYCMAFITWCCCSVAMLRRWCSTGCRPTFVDLCAHFPRCGGIGGGVRDIMCMGVTRLVPDRTQVNGKKMC